MQRQFSEPHFENNPSSYWSCKKKQIANNSIADPLCLGTCSCSQLLCDDAKKEKRLKFKI